MTSISCNVAVHMTNLCCR